jgi:2'-5' RNA ligase
MNAAAGPGSDMAGAAHVESTVVRAFFALWPEPAVADELLARSRAVPLELGAERQPRERLHMTVAFVGEVSADRSDVLREVGRRQCARTVPLRFDLYEYWPKPEVVVAAAREVPAALGQFWESLHRELAVRAFALTPKRLRPHVTLARKVTQAPVLPPLSPLTWHARSFSLVHSTRVGTHPVYTVVDTWPLLDN